MILATGSSPVIPDIPGIDLPQVMTSRDILRMDDWNFDCLTVIGGGVIGVEIATIFAALGSRVTLLEQANRLLESMDPMISEQMEANLRSKGIEVHCNVQVMEIKDRGNDTVSVNYRCELRLEGKPGGPRAGGSRQTPEYVEGSVGRLSGQLENGRPLIKGTYRTTQENVYAIGDTVARKRLAHVAASMRLIWSKTWRDADTGCSFRSCRTVCMSCFRLCRPVFIRSRRLRRLDLRK